MGNRRISSDLKEASLRLKARRRDTDEEIAQIVGFSISTLYRALAQKRKTGSVVKPPPIKTGRPRSLAQIDADFLLSLARHNPTLFLDEYRSRLEQYRALHTSMATIHRTFIRANLSVKQVQKLALERCPMKRADFIRRIGPYPTHYLISIDEMSKDDRTYARLWGRSVVGQRAEVHQPFVRKRRFSLVAAMSVGDGIFAAKVVEGSFTRVTFMSFLRECVLPLTTPYPGPNSVLVMDNARIHHSPEIEDLVHGYGCRIEYLPPYSPDFAPIEQAFSAIKAHLRRIGITHHLNNASYFELYDACSIITPSMAEGFFRHSGYLV